MQNNTTSNYNLVTKQLNWHLYDGVKTEHYI